MFCAFENEDESLRGTQKSESLELPRRFSYDSVVSYKLKIMILKDLTSIFLQHKFENYFADSKNAAQFSLNMLF